MSDIITGATLAPLTAEQDAALAARMREYLAANPESPLTSYTEALADVASDPTLVHRLDREDPRDILQEVRETARARSETTEDSAAERARSHHHLREAARAAMDVTVEVVHASAPEPVAAPQLSL